MYNYYFKIANLLICIRTPFVFHDFYELNSYRIANEDSREADVVYILQILDDEWKIEGKKIQEVRKSCVYETEQMIFRYYFWNIYTEQKFIVLAHRKNEYSKFILYIQRDSMQELLKEFHFAPLMSMEQVLLKHDTFQLHSSVISWNGKGILFTAPSGTGKSTQADLWKRYEGAQIVNGDRALIQKTGDKYLVYGSPYAGTSNIYTNISVPICAIIVLSQGSENRIEQLNGAKAFSYIYKESTICTWDTWFVSQYTNLLIDLLCNVSVYHLTCRPDKEAVDLVKNALLGDLSNLSKNI